MKKFNVLYNGRKIYKDLSAEECTEVLQELSERFYSDEEFDLSLTIKPLSFKKLFNVYKSNMVFNIPS